MKNKVFLKKRTQIHHFSLIRLAEILKSDNANLTIPSVARMTQLLLAGM